MQKEAQKEKSSDERAHTMRHRGLLKNISEDELGKKKKRRRQRLEYFSIKDIGCGLLEK